MGWDYFERRYEETSQERDLRSETSWMRNSDPYKNMGK